MISNLYSFFFPFFVVHSSLFCHSLLLIDLVFLIFIFFSSLFSSIFSFSSMFCFFVNFFLKLPYMDFLASFFYIFLSFYLSLTFFYYWVFYLSSLSFFIYSCCLVFFLCSPLTYLILFVSSVFSLSLFLPQTHTHVCFSRNSLFYSHYFFNF